MWHRLIMAAASTVLLALSGGCTKVVRLSMEEARKQPKEKPRAVEIAVAIRGVEMKTGEFVAFSEPTGDYRPQTHELAGTNTSGDSVVVPLKETRAIHVRPVDRLTTENTVIPVDAFFLNYSDHAAPDIGKGPYPLKTRIKFNRHKGLIDTVRNSVTGTSKARLPVNVDCDDVFRVEYKRFSLGKTLIITGVYVGIMSAILGGIAYGFSHAEWTSNSSDWSY